MWSRFGKPFEVRSESQTDQKLLPFDQGENFVRSSIQEAAFLPTLFFGLSEEDSQGD
jgi:hypothetical protein